MNLLEEILAPTYGGARSIKNSLCVSLKRLQDLIYKKQMFFVRLLVRRRQTLTAKVKKSFITGAKKVGTVDKDTAEEILAGLKVFVGMLLTSHIVYPMRFVLTGALIKKLTIQKNFSYRIYTTPTRNKTLTKKCMYLISEAKLFDIQARTPSIANFDTKFNVKNHKVYFGVKDIKSLTGKTGDKVVDGIKLAEETCKKNIKKFTWLEILLYFAPNINSTAFKALASVGIL